jgi:hypothetical protein
MHFNASRVQLVQPARLGQTAIHDIERSLHEIKTKARKERPDLGGRVHRHADLLDEASFPKNRKRRAQLFASRAEEFPRSMQKKSVHAL